MGMTTFGSNPNATSSSDFKIKDFIDSKYPISLYLTVPFAHIDRISPVFKLVINFMLRKFSEGETIGLIKDNNGNIMFCFQYCYLGIKPKLLTFLKTGST